ILSQSLVELRPAGQLVNGLEWSAIASMGQNDLTIADALTQTRRTEPPADVVRFAKRVAKKQSPHQAALEICRFVFERMTYKAGVTGVHSVAKEAWANKLGVCQDYAHIALGALRSIGIPARYVSGYFHPDKEPKLHETVQAESHAWVEWYVGGSANEGWFAFDPTNNIEVIDRHIVVGKARDYDDLAPLRGVYAGHVSSELLVRVEITREA
ncbi:MAG: transglutaminase family protein, partial [Actinomycetales bacterium]|nr:transglutaminase family protein [Actinomycetales bacterium]